MRMLLAVLILLTAVGPGRADDVAGLYRAVAVVTGTGEANRRIGFRLAVEDAIVRVSGDYRLIATGKARFVIDRAADYVSSFSYRDRLEGVPVHDEQGTHDRPHDLTVDFDRAKLDAALAAMGSRPWMSPRPRLAVFLAVKAAGGAFVLAGDSEQGSYMRDSFEAASRKIAIPIALPSQALIGGGRLDAIPTTDIAGLDAAAVQAGGDQALAGRLEWSDADRGWIAEWRLAFAGREYDWHVAGVSFDDAFRNALRGAAQVLSGNGRPDSD